MVKIKQNLKLIILAIVILLLLGFVAYYLFIPEYYKSKDVNEAYIYIKDGNSEQKYTVKYNEELSIKVKNKEYSILLPYNHTVLYDWRLNPITENTTLSNSFIKEFRTPIYDKGKDGVDYSMKIFEFQNNKQSTEKLVFKYIDTNQQENDGSKSIIINIQHE